MTALTLIEKLELLKWGVAQRLRGIVETRNESIDEAIAVVRQHEAEQQAATLSLTRPRFSASDAHEAKSLATQMQVEQAFHFAMQKCLPNWGDGDFVDGGNLLALVSTAIAAIGRASDTGIGNNASMAHQQDHALTPPASDADRSDPASGLLSMHIGTRQLSDEAMIAVTTGKARPEDYGMKQVYPAPTSEAYRKVEEALRCADRFCASWHPSYATIGEALDVLPVLKPKPDAPTPKDAALQVAVEALTWLCVREVHYDTDVRSAPDLTSDAWARADAALAQIKAILEGRRP